MKTTSDNYEAGTPGLDRRTRARRAFILAGALGGIVLLLGLGLILYMSSLRSGLPSFEQLENPEVDLATVVYTADGELLTRFARQDRTPVPLDSVSSYVVDALISTEDYRFYSHWGMDPFRIVSAVTKTLLGNRQGGSTITQQLARNLYTEQVGNEISVNRKLKEWMTALQLERNYTKKEILEMYLNTVPFGYNTFGISTASQTYFGKTPGELSLTESALLIGMLKGTTRYNPLRNPERATRRRNQVLNQMIRFGGLDEAVGEAAKEDSLGLNFRPITHTDNLAPYFAEHVRLWMRDWARETGHDIYTDGLIVYTTIDSELQRLAEEAVAEQLDGLQAVVDIDWSRARGRVRHLEIDEYRRVREAGGYVPFETYWRDYPDLEDQMIEETPEFRERLNAGMSALTSLKELRADAAFIDSLRATKERLEVGFVAIDPATRHIKAWIGGRDYATDMYDHVAIAKRQAGSTFKPFLYTAAIDNGYSPYYRLLDDSVTIDLPGEQDDWKPKNSGDEYSGRLMTLREGLARSVNSVTARLVDEVGGDQVANYASLMGVNSPLERVHSLALGVSDVSLLEMTNAYATLGAGGFYGEPIFVTRITDRSGNLLADFSSDQREVLSEQTTYTVVDMLRGVIDHGTGVRVRAQFGVQGDVVGKTGTTQNSADGWFMMLHPQLAMGAWVGFNDRRMSFREWWGQGAHNALLVVGDFFSRLEENAEPSFNEARFLPPEGYVVPAPVFEHDEDTIVDDKKGGEDKGRIGW